MKQAQRIAALFLVVGAALLGGFFGGKATDAGAAGTTVNCNIPNNVVCTVSNPAGIKSVKVTVDFGNLGNIAVVDQTYPACPKSVDVSWDPIVPNYHFTVEACSELKLTNGNPPVVGGTLKGVIAITPAPSGQGSHRTHKPIVMVLRADQTFPTAPGLGLTGGPQTGVLAIPESCGGPYSFIPCNQWFKSLCSILGGDYIPGEGGTGKCDDAHDWPSDPSPPRP